MEKEFNFRGLSYVLKTFNETWKGSYESGMWSIGSGGYDLEWELYYDNKPICCQYAYQAYVTFYISEDYSRKSINRLKEYLVNNLGNTFLFEEYDITPIYKLVNEYMREKMKIYSSSYVLSLCDDNKIEESFMEWIRANGKDTFDNKAYTNVLKSIGADIDSMFNKIVGAGKTFKYYNELHEENIA